MKIHLIHHILQVLNPNLYQEDCLKLRTVPVVILWDFFVQFCKVYLTSDQTLWGDPSIDSLINIDEKTYIYSFKFSSEKNGQLH